MTTTLAQVRARYDSVPYVSYPYMHSAPHQLAAVACLFGLAAPPIDTARVLELGCSSGGNLIPLALRYPRLQALGLDLSGVQIDLGQQHIRRLGLTNVALREADLAQLQGPSLGQFDYIICHGLYSWVPPHVQEAMLRICADHLAPEGVAFVSYNTYPGWKSKEIIRDAMLLQGEQWTSTQAQVDHARGLVGFLRELAKPDTFLSKALEENMPFLRNAQSHYLAHEYLEPYNLPCYFKQFVERAAGRGLAYLAEAQPSMMMPVNYGKQVAEPLYRAFGHDRVLMEQYLDFAVNRGYRQSLLVHAARAGDIRYPLERKDLQSLHFAANLPCQAGATRYDGSVQEYGKPGSSVSVSLGGAKRAIDLLTQAWPSTLSRGELIGQVEASPGIGEVTRDVLETAIDELLWLVLRSRVRIGAAPVCVGTTAGARPCLDPLVRRMASALGEEDTQVANAWHESVELSAAERVLYPLMDGSRDRDALIRLLVEHVPLGGVSVLGGQAAVETAGGIDRAASACVDRMLASLREKAVLQG